MRTLRAVSDRVAHDDRPEPVLTGIDSRRTHAAARRASCDDQRVDALAVQHRRKARSEEAGGELLDEDNVSCLPVEPRVDRDLRRSAAKRPQPLLLEPPDAGIAQFRVVVGDSGEEYRNAAFARCLDYAIGGGNLGRQLGAERHLRIGEGNHEIDDQQRRPPAEPDALAEALSFIGSFPLRFLDLHSATSRLYDQR